MEEKKNKNKFDNRLYMHGVTKTIPFRFILTRISLKCICDICQENFTRMLKPMEEQELERFRFSDECKSNNQIKYKMHNRLVKWI